MKKSSFFPKINRSLLMLMLLSCTLGLTSCDYNDQYPEIEEQLLIDQLEGKWSIASFKIDQKEQLESQKQQLTFEFIKDSNKKGIMNLTLASSDGQSCSNVTPFIINNEQSFSFGMFADRGCGDIFAQGNFDLQDISSSTFKVEALRKVNGAVAGVITLQAVRKR